jgi:hypothetical protein
MAQIGNQVGNLGRRLHELSVYKHDVNLVQRVTQPFRIFSPKLGKNFGKHSLVETVDGIEHARLDGYLNESSDVTDGAPAEMKTYGS